MPRSFSPTWGKPNTSVKNFRERSRSLTLRTRWPTLLILNDILVPSNDYSKKGPVRRSTRSDERKEFRDEDSVHAELVEAFQFHVAVLHRQDNLAKVLPPFQIALRCAGFCQRENLADHHLKLFFLNEFQNLVELP